MVNHVIQVHAPMVLVVLIIIHVLVWMDGQEPIATREWDVTISTDQLQMEIQTTVPI